MAASLESVMRLPQSEQLKKLRELLMNKIEMNEFLYNLFTNPQMLICNDKPFQFHPVRLEPSDLEFDI